MLLWDAVTPCFGDLLKAHFPLLVEAEEASLATSGAAKLRDPQCVGLTHWRPGI